MVGQLEVARRTRRREIAYRYVSTTHRNGFESIKSPPPATPYTTAVGIHEGLLFGTEGTPYLRTASPIRYRRSSAPTPYVGSFVLPSQVRLQSQAASIAICPADR